jgi:hypothetical protein
MRNPGSFSNVSSHDRTPFRPPATQNDVSGDCLVNRRTYSLYRIALAVAFVTK